MRPTYTISVSSNANRILRDLVSTGFFGIDVPSAIERLLDQKLVELVEKGRDYPDNKTS
jgi:hypothetical protein